ncbi:MAG TPA: sulfide/dihydroorotate dehydrogenase-like FAD/NAD-binding protein [bacterium]|nr:sulfide/dihydroorotate dehydrogenase-like FAD/NAD-binding protein [bacterium]
MNKIIKKEQLAEKIKRIEVISPIISKKAKPGQFIVLRVDEKGERIPLTIADVNKEKETITLIFQEVGTTTAKLGFLENGENILDIVGPLGKATEIEKYGNVCIIVGGVGAAFIFWMAKTFKEKENYLITIIGARNKDLIILEEELKNISDEIYITTDDGSKGRKGFNTEMLVDLIQHGEKIDYCLTAGPIPMMKKVSEITKEHNIKTIASLNPIMVDGTGMCGCCRVSIGGETKFACVDGPDFDAHLVNFDELLKRTSFYKEMEKISYEKFINSCKCTSHQQK